MKVKLRGIQCEANVQLHFDSRSDKIFFFRSDAAHTHDESATPVFKFTEAEEQFVKELLEARTKPKQIKYNLVKKNMQVPPDNKLSSILSRMRKEIYGSDKLHIGTLEKWLRECQSMPENETDPFILNFETDVSDKKNVKFRFLITR